MPLRADCLFAGSRESAETAVGETLALEVAQAIGLERGYTAFAHLRLFDDEIFDLCEEPRVDIGQFFYAFTRPTRAERVRDEQQAIRAGCSQLIGELVALFLGELVPELL